MTLIPKHQLRAMIFETSQTAQYFRARICDLRPISHTPEDVVLVDKMRAPWRKALAEARRDLVGLAFYYRLHYGKPVNSLPLFS